MIANPEQLALLILISIWDLIWKGLALWKARENNHLKWFVVILIFNTVGILPLIYLRFFSKSLK